MPEPPSHGDDRASQCPFVFQQSGNPCVLPDELGAHQDEHAEYNTSVGPWAMPADLQLRGLHRDSGGNTVAVRDGFRTRWTWSKKYEPWHALEENPDEPIPYVIPEGESDRIHLAVHEHEPDSGDVPLGEWGSRMREVLKDTPLHPLMSLGAIDDLRIAQGRPWGSLMSVGTHDFPVAFDLRGGDYYEPTPYADLVHLLRREVTPEVRDAAKTMLYDLAWAKTCDEARAEGITVMRLSPEKEYRFLMTHAEVHYWLTWKGEQWLAEGREKIGYPLRIWPWVNHEHYRMSPSGNRRVSWRLTKSLLDLSEVLTSPDNVMDSVMARWFNTSEPVVTERLTNSQCPLCGAPLLVSQHGAACSDEDCPKISGLTEYEQAYFDIHRRT